MRFLPDGSFWMKEINVAESFGCLFMLIKTLTCLRNMSKEQISTNLLDLSNLAEVYVHVAVSPLPGSYRLHDEGTAELFGL